MYRLREQINNVPIGVLDIIKSEKHNVKGPFINFLKTNAKINAKTS